MGVLTIECSDRTDEPCACCGGTTTRLTRFVHRDGDAHAVYYASFSNHPERIVTVLLSLGGWGEGSTPEDRAAFALRIRSVKAEYQVMVADAAKTLWGDAEFLGRMLDRPAALKHPWIKEAFHISDHIVMEDPDVRNYLNGTDAN